jgi:hypothetical protein
MKPEVSERLDALRQDFANVAGRPFEHFFCPFLFVDEQAELCKAHIVNDAFPGSSRQWTLQRKDVDNFFGSMFESAFVNLQFNEPGIALKALFAPELYRRIRPKITLDGEEVEYFVAKGPVPKRFAELRIEREGASVTLALKMSRERLASVKDESDWRFEVSHDLRVESVVSVLKAAHLTMFGLMGYSYALRPGGVWLGQLLGLFYAENIGRSKESVLLNALEHFGPFAAMVRPVEGAPPAFTGTVDDRWVHFCWSNDSSDRTPWGILTYVRTGEARHAVVLPALEHQAGADRFLQFLNARGDAFEISLARYEGSRWGMEHARRSVVWPVESWGSPPPDGID